MAHRTRSPDLLFAEHVENPESFKRRNAENLSVALARSDDSENRPPGRDENKRSVCDRKTELLERTGARANANTQCLARRPTTSR